MKDEKRLKSRLKKMELKYFLVTLGCFIAVYLLFFVIFELVFTIFSIKPYLRVAICIVLFLCTYRLTDKILNTNMQIWLHKEDFVDLGKQEAAQAKQALEPQPRKIHLFKKQKAETVEEPLPLPARKQVPVSEPVLPDSNEPSWKTPFEQQETQNIDFQETQLITKETYEQQKQKEEIIKETQIPAQDVSTNWTTPFEEIDTGDLHVVLENKEDDTV